MTATPRAISPQEAKALVHGGGEVAFLDVREHGQYGEGHPFLAVPCPFSRLEVAVRALAPRAGVPIILLDDGDGIAERAGAALAAMGYRDVSFVYGGASAWEAGGFTLFKGVNVPSKTLGELLEERWHVPRIDVGTLAAWQDEARSLALFDGRPAAEFAKTTLPGAHSMPNGELPHRLRVAVPDEAVPIIVHCAGRTRSIVGAAGLAIAGVPNPVYALENGTQGWALSGRRLKRDAVPDPLPALDDAGREASAERANAILARHGIPAVDARTLIEIAADPARTLYVLDVRSAEEFAAGTVPGAVHAPAVQLAQATDEWIGVCRARVVLCDDTGLRAALGAVFLRMLGHEVFVLTGAERASTGFERADAPTAPSLPSLPELPAADVSALLADGAALLDLRGSMAFRAGHIEGARWSIRSRLPDLDPARPAVLVGPAVATALVATDLLTRNVRVAGRLGGSPADWRGAGLAVVASPADPPDSQAIDYLFFVHDRHEGNMEAARRYLNWETGLTRQLDAAELAEFRIGPSPFS